MSSSSDSSVNSISLHSSPDSVTMLSSSESSSAGNRTVNRFTVYVDLQCGYPMKVGIHGLFDQVWQMPLAYGFVPGKTEAL